MSRTFRTRRRVTFSDTDLAGIAHFANFFRYMEDAEHELWRSVGISVVHRLPDGAYLTWPRVHACCDYRQPARFEDELEITITVARSGSKALRFSFQFTRDGDAIADGLLVAVCCRFADGQLEAVEIPPDVLARLAPYLDQGHAEAG